MSLEEVQRASGSPTLAYGGKLPAFAPAQYKYPKELTDEGFQKGKLRALSNDIQEMRGMKFCVLESNLKPTPSRSSRGKRGLSLDSSVMRQPSSTQSGHKH
jgi:hypothetical protein